MATAKKVSRLVSYFSIVNSWVHSQLVVQIVQEGATPLFTLRYLLLERLFYLLARLYLNITHSLSSTFPDP